MFVIQPRQKFHFSCYSPIKLDTFWIKWDSLDSIQTSVEFNSHLNTASNRNGTIIAYSVANSNVCKPPVKKEKIQTRSLLNRVGETSLSCHTMHPAVSHCVTFYNAC